MAKKAEDIEMEGIVTEVLGNGKYRVQVTGTDHMVICHLCGRMKQMNIRVIFGDTVKFIVSPIDLTNGRIMFRVKK